MSTRVALWLVLVMVLAAVILSGALGPMHSGS